MASIPQLTYSSLPLVALTLTISLISLMETVDTEFNEASFNTVRICGSLGDLVQNDCTWSQAGGSHVECALRCVSNSSCLGSVLDEGRACHLLHMCDYAWDNMNCDPNTVTHVKVHRKTCQNGGVYTKSRDVVCQCFNGWIGELCDRRATRCKDLSGFGYAPATDIVVQLNIDSQLKTVKCVFAPTYHYVGLFANSGMVDKSYSWSDYKNGYFVNKQNYWLGLESMHSLTKDPDANRFGKAIFNFYAYDETDGVKYWTKDLIYYIGFGVRNESSNYSYFYSRVDLDNGIAFNTVETPMENCLGNRAGIPFSSWDRDNDLDPNHNCAFLAGTGWWFDTCILELECNPLGTSVKILPPPAQDAHIAFKGLDMINSTYSTNFLHFELHLVSMYTAHSYSDI